VDGLPRPRRRALIATRGHHAPAATTIELPQGKPAQGDCAPHADNEAITGAHGTASAIGWPGNEQGVVTCLGGRFFVQGDIERAYGFGIYADEPTTWVDTDGYLPEQVTSFSYRGVDVAITEFADRVVLDGTPFVAVYARVRVDNHTDATTIADPAPSAGLARLGSAATRVVSTSLALDYRAYVPVLRVGTYGRSTFELRPG